MTSDVAGVGAGAGGAGVVSGDMEESEGLMEETAEDVFSGEWSL